MHGIIYCGLRNYPFVDIYMGKWENRFLEIFRYLEDRQRIFSTAFISLFFKSLLTVLFISARTRFET
jgi:hypothetical protein